MSRRYSQPKLRHRRDRVSTTPPGPELDLQLRALATMLDELAERGGWGADPQLVFQAPVGSASGSFDLGLKALEDGASAVEYLRGFSAPRHWHTLGVISEGSASHLNEEGTRVTGAAGRVRVVHLVHRSGASTSVLRQPQLEPLVFSHPPGGRIDDYCRRALGIGCAPPRCSTLELWSTIWLDELISQVPRTWPHAAELHPAVRVLRSGPGACSDLSPADELIAFGRALAKVAPWEKLRTESASGRSMFRGFSPELARWLDEGSFSREVLGGWPPWEDLADAASDLLPLPVGDRVADALSQWGLT